MKSSQGCTAEVDLDRGGVEKRTELPVVENRMERNGVHQRNFYSSRELSISGPHNLQLNSDKAQKMRMDSLIEKGMGKRRRVRFIKKSGHCNVSHKHMKDKSRRFLADIFTTGVDLQWRYNLLVFSAAFILSWILFGLLYWAESYRHGDFDLQFQNNSIEFRACIDQLDIDYPFTSTFLFSLETQTTIGYGYRHVTEECWITITIVVFQSVFGCILDAFMIGLIMAKISRPKKRAETLLFSNHAVINMRDGRLCLMVRVGNLRKSHLVESTIKMQLIRSRTTSEGEYIPVEQIDLHLDLTNDSDRLFLVTPQTICHPIEEDSPLWELKPKDLENNDFEVIVILEGMVEATGMTTQARASYLPNEILWGHRFRNVISMSSSNAYKVNFKEFHNTYLLQDAVQKSAKELFEAEEARLKVLKRPKRAIKKTSSDSSSSRSSTASHHHFSAEEKDSGYTALETTAHSGSKSSLNKALTSTTSLSEDSDGGKDEKQVVEEKRESASSSLIDLTVPQQAELIESVNVPGECDSTDASSKPLENELLIELEPTETPSNDNQITNKIFAPVPADQNSLESQSPLWVSNLNQTKEL